MVAEVSTHAETSEVLTMGFKPRLYDAAPSTPPPIQPGALPPKVDLPLEIPDKLPQTVPNNEQERFQSTPIYDSLT